MLDTYRYLLRAYFFIIASSSIYIYLFGLWEEGVALKLGNKGFKRWGGGVFYVGCVLCFGYRRRKGRCLGWLDLGMGLVNIIYFCVV